MTTESPATDAVARFEAPLRAYVARLLHDAEEARDVVQDTFLRLVRAPRSETEGRMAEWLYTVARHRAIDVQRKRRRIEALAPGRAAETPDPAHGAVAAAEIVDEADRARRCVAELPENQREVIGLRLKDGLSYKEIAAVTGLTTANVGWLIHVGLKAVRARLNGKDGDRG
jgi:RNA polymerase sigma factor (sigma-70 family)